MCEQQQQPRDSFRAFLAFQLSDHDVSVVDMRDVRDDNVTLLRI